MGRGRESFSCATVWNGTGLTIRRNRPPFQAVPKREQPFNLAVALRVAHTACHRGGSVLIDGGFGGKPCHTACEAREIPSPEREEYGIDPYSKSAPMRIVT